MQYMQTFSTGGGGDDSLESANNIGGGSGLSERPAGNYPIETNQLTAWLTSNYNAGAETYTDAAMWKEYISGPAWSQKYGQPLTKANYRQAAKEESQRLWNLGFTQVHNVENARLIYEGYARAASEDFSYLPVTEETAQLQADVVEKYSWEYITGNIGKSIGNVVKKAGDTAEDLGETITNPFTLPSLAVLGVVGLIVFAKIK